MEEDGYEEKTIGIKGMHCASCKQKIEEKISQLHGVDSINVDIAKEKAHIRFDSTQIDVAEIKAEIDNLGYDTGSGKAKSSVRQGIVYGLIPHIGCIAFIIGSVLGVTVLMEFFKPLLMNRWFFHALILLSLVFATLSSAWYLRKNGLLSLDGMKRKWKYLSAMYGSTIGINLVLFMLIFPLLANVSLSASGVYAIGADSIRLEVDIPCPGHAPLISSELKTIDGVTGVQFSFPNIFDVSYDSAKTDRQKMLSLDVFKEYPAKVLSESPSNQIIDSGNPITGKSTDSSLAAIKDGVQIVQLSVQGSNYYPNPIRVKKGIPVQLVADMNSVKGCSRSIVIPEYGIKKTLKTGDNVIEFTPDKSGTFKFACSMNMYQGQIVVENSDGSVAAYTGIAPALSGSSGSCGCGCGSK
ncbi:MAG: cation transporter [Candidatus Aenigmatarchaeota archaeon]